VNKTDRYTYREAAQAGADA
jgi:hypothetical protein